MFQFFRNFGEVIIPCLLKIKLKNYHKCLYKQKCIHFYAEYIKHL